eukprot:INCI15891.1.p1 GENE.INCI15891.1~~INCI15891.1.p1  ORF type:complete len:794 (+),score=116.97 INCI15891.1:217-2598(+)
MEDKTYNYESTAAYRSNVVTICDALLQCVGSSFGPAGADTVLVEPGSAIVVTQSGNSILQSLRVSHPVAGFILRAVNEFAAIVGDATTTFVIVLCTAIRLVFESLQPSGWNAETETVQLHRIVSAFEHIRRHFNTLIASPLMKRCCNLPPSNAVVASLKGESASVSAVGGGQPTAPRHQTVAAWVETKIYHLILTSISASFSVDDAAALTATFVNWIFQAPALLGAKSSAFKPRESTSTMAPDNDVQATAMLRALRSVLDAGRAMAETFVVHCPGFAVQESATAEDGSFYLSKGFDANTELQMQSPPDLSGDEGVRFILFDCPLQFSVRNHGDSDSDDDGSATMNDENESVRDVYVSRPPPRSDMSYQIDVNSGASFSHLVSTEPELATKLVAFCKTWHVNLLLTSGAVSVPVAQACAYHGIGLVTYIAAAELSVLSNRAAVWTPSTLDFDSIPAKASIRKMAFVAEAASAKLEVLDRQRGRRCVVIAGLKRSAQQPPFQPADYAKRRVLPLLSLRQMLLCAPSAGLCQQYHRLFLRIVQQLVFCLDHALDIHSPYFCNGGRIVLPSPDTSTTTSHRVIAFLGPTISVIPGAGVVESALQSHFQTLADNLRLRRSIPESHIPVSHSNPDINTRVPPDIAQILPEAPELLALPQALEVIAKALASIPQQLFTTALSFNAGTDCSDNATLHSVLKFTHEMQQRNVQRRNGDESSYVLDTRSKEPASMGLVPKAVAVPEGSPLSGAGSGSTFVVIPPQDFGVIEAACVKGEMLRHVLDALITLLRTQAVVKVKRKQ